MKYGSIPGIDKRVSRIGQGVVMIGGQSEDDAFRLLDACFEAGVTLYDSAHLYQTDARFGAWVRSRKIEKQVVLLDKCCHHHGNVDRVTPECITSDLTDCLARLQYGPIDMFLFHRDVASQPVGPLVECLNEHLAAGRISAFGGSNWTHQRIQAANDYAASRGLKGFVVSSPHYSLAEMYNDPWGRGSVTIAGPKEQEARAWYLANGMAIAPWSSLAGGFFSGKIHRGGYEKFENGGEERCMKVYGGEDNFRRLDRAQELAAAKGVNASQIALAWIICGPLNTFPLMAAWTPQQARENAAAADIELTPEEVAWLDLRRDSRK